MGKKYFAWSIPDTAYDNRWSGVFIQIITTGAAGGDFLSEFIIIKAEF